MSASSRFGVATTLLVVLLALFAQAARAHTAGTAVRANEPAGPYLVTIWVDPVRPTAGQEVHISVAVVEPLTVDGAVIAGPAVLGASVNVAFTLVDDGDRQMAEATSAGAANPQFYEARLTPLQAGVWAGQVAVVGPAGGGEVAFELTIEDEPAPVLLAGLVVILFVGLMGGLVWRWRQDP